jgi:GGDEF domain-containing protein
MTATTSDEEAVLDDAIGNLLRIRSDTARQRAGWRWLEATAAGWARDARLALISLDIDSSAEIRRHGITPKVELVGLCRERARATVPAAALIIDSGTRDETVVALPELDASWALTVAESVRRAVSCTPFWLCSLAAHVSVTVSCGVGTGRADDLAAVREGARAGLAIAKSSRNTCAVGTNKQVQWMVQLPDALTAACQSGGIGIGSGAAEYVDDVITKYTGIRYWLITRGLDAGTDAGVRLDTWREQIVAAIGQPDPGYLSLLDAVVQEWSVQQAQESVKGGSSVASSLHEARHGKARTRHMVTLPASVASEVTLKVIRPYRMTRSDVICEALSIALDNQQLGET